MHEGYPCIAVLTQACRRCITSKQIGAHHRCTMYITSVHHQCTSSVHISAPRPLSRPVSHRGSPLAGKQVAAGASVSSSCRRAGRDKGRGTSSSFRIFALAQDREVDLLPILRSFLAIVHVPTKSLVVTVRKNGPRFVVTKE